MIQSVASAMLSDKLFFQLDISICSYHLSREVIISNIVLHLLG